MIHPNTHIIITVKENRPETLNYRSVIFERPIGFQYEPGDWIDISVKGQNFTGGKTYSLSSSPSETDLMITFKDGLSELKHALMESTAGDEFVITQYGNDYKFTLKPSKSSTLIAGGVGVAPFRSMLLEMVANHDKNLVHLIFLNQTSSFLFEDQLKRCLKILPGFSATFIVTNELKSKDKKKAILTAVKSFSNSFYIAGPEGMVESTEHLLIDAGVNVSDIKIDSFGGY